MLHAGPDISRRKLNICLLSEEGEPLDQLAVPPDPDSLKALARRLEEVHREPICAVIGQAAVLEAPEPKPVSDLKEQPSPHSLSGKVTNSGVDGPCDPTVHSLFARRPDGPGSGRPTPVTEAQPDLPGTR